MARLASVGSGSACRPWRVGGARAGLTLVELLAAMMVLLVGVWSVAALFPKLSREVVDEERHMTTARQAQELAASYRADPLSAEVSTSPLPLRAVDPNGSNTETADPVARPQDPDSTNLSDNPPNGRDDWVWVWGETFVIPQPWPAGGVSAYLPRGGLLDQTDHWYDAADGAVTDHSNRADRHVAGLQVFEHRKLKRVAKASQVQATSNSFFLRDDGTLLSNPDTVKLQISYSWYDSTDGFIKRTAREWVLPYEGLGANVVDAGAAVVPGDEEVWAVYEFGVAPLGSGPSPRVCAVASPYRQALLFDARDAGTKVSINYRTLREGGRRELYMQESSRIPMPAEDPNQSNLLTMPPIKLAFAGLDDERPLLSLTPSGTREQNVYLLAVAEGSGTALAWEAVLDGGAANPTLTTVETDPPDARFPFRNVDFTNGTVELNPYHPFVASNVGQPIRLLYRTIDDNCVQLQKAPARFAPVSATTDAVGLATAGWWQMVGERYKIGRRDRGALPPVAYLYDFSRHLEDQAVQVDYLVRPAGSTSPVRVNGEVHVLADLQDPGLGIGCVLNEPNVVGVLQVRGVSLRVCGWWRTPSGRVRMTDISGILFPGA